MGFAIALGIGLLIGADRERRKGDGPSRAAAGIRTFAIVSLAGAAGHAIGGEVLLAASSPVWSALAGLSYWRAGPDDPGLTTEVALVLTTLLGALAMSHPGLAAGVGVVVAALLHSREKIHGFVRSALTEDELRDAIIFAGATLVVLPLLPDEPLDPYGVFNLRLVWIVVILVMAVSGAGYIAIRLLGVRFGLPLSGFAARLRVEFRHHRRDGRAREAGARPAAARRGRRCPVDGGDHRRACPAAGRHEHGGACRSRRAAGLRRRRSRPLWRPVHLVGAQA